MKVLKIAGYVAFFFCALMVWIYWTFPWAAAKDRALNALSQASGMEIEADKLEPNWITGVHAEKVRIYQTPGAEPLEVERLDARAHVLTFLTGGQGATASLPLAGGDINVDFSKDDTMMEIEAQVDGLELALLQSLKDSLGMPLGGELSLDADVDIGVKDIKKSNGTIKLKGKGLEILKGGKISGFPVPELVIGDLDWKIPVKDGKATFDKQKVSGDNVEIVVDGEIILHQHMARNTLNLSLSFKPTAAFLKKEPILGALLNNIKRAKGKDGFYTYAVNGSVKRPRFTARRK